MILDQFKLNDRTALVTGASTGLGAAIAIALAEAGAHVACHGNARSPESTVEQIESAGGVAYPITGDLSKAKTAQDLVTQTLDRFSRIDILINNARTIRRAPAGDYSRNRPRAPVPPTSTSPTPARFHRRRQSITPMRTGRP